MKSQAVKTKATRTATVSRPHPAVPFFQKNKTEVGPASSMGQDIPSRPWFEKAGDGVGWEAEALVNRADEESGLVPVKEEGSGRKGKLIHLITPRTIAREAETEGPQAIPVQPAPEPLQPGPPVGDKTPETVEAPEVEVEPEVMPAGPEPTPPITVPLAEPPVETAPPAAVAETPSEIGQQFNALPPSAQADAYTGLGAALDASVTKAAVQTQDEVPDLHVSLEGDTEPPATPVIAVPAATPSTAGKLYAAAPEPAVEIPETPVQTAVSQPDVPVSPPAEGQGLDEALGTIDPAPAIETTLDSPEIPLEGKADPAALDVLETAATDEAARTVTEAQAGIKAVTPDVVQARALDEIVTAPPPAEMEVPGNTPQVEGMDKLAGYGLSPLDRTHFDAQVGPSMEAAVSSAQSEMARREQDFDMERAALNTEAEAEAAAAQTEGRAQQQLEVEKSREALAAEQQRTLDQQQSAADGALNQLSASKNESTQKIDGRLAADRASVDGIYTTAQADAETKLAQGTAESEAEERKAAEQAEAESWWDWAIDSWQALVQMVADVVVAIWERVIEEVAGILDRAIELATAVVTAAVSFVKLVVSAYFDLWTWLIDNLLGTVFPELAAAFRAWIDALKTKLFAALDAMAAIYLQALRFIADKLVAGLYLILEAYKAGVAAYLALWEAIQNAQWADIGRTVLSAMLSAVGIDPEEFFATFAKIGEVIDEIIADPTLIAKRAIDALALGFKQFGTNFVGNFITAFVEWITGASGLVLPKTFSLAGIFDVVCQILHLTYDYLRAKAVQHLGEGAVTAVEELFAAIKAFISGGWSGLWNLVKDKLTTLVDDVVIAAGTWLVEKAILVVGRWITGLVTTLGWSSLVEGLIALWQFIMWIKDQFQQFWQIVKSTVDSVHEFVKGMIQPAANTIEGTLQDLIIPAIDLVAKLLNLGNIAKKVEQIVESVRKMIDEAIDGVVESLKKTLGRGKKDGKEDKDEAEGEEEKDGRHGKITLATLKEPPVTLPRTKAEELMDFEAAHQVLKIAETQVVDTAELAEYFDAIQRRFRLKHIGYEASTGGIGVEIEINPEKFSPIDLFEAVPEDQKHELGEGKTLTKWKKKQAKDVFTGSSNNFKADPAAKVEVGIMMVSDPLGPDHPQGSTTDSTQDVLMAWLQPSPESYKKGHLLNHWVGGSGHDEYNLFPITAQANSLMETKIEKDVKNWVNEEKYYIYYAVNITPGTCIFGNPADRSNSVAATIEAQAGIRKTGGELANERRVVIRSTPKTTEKGEPAGDFEPLPEGDEQVPVGEELERNLTAEPKIPIGETKSSKFEDIAKNAADTAEEYARFMKEVVDALNELEAGTLYLSTLRTQADEVQSHARESRENQNQIKQGLENKVPNFEPTAKELSEGATSFAELAANTALTFISAIREQMKAEPPKHSQVAQVAINRIRDRGRDIGNRSNDLWLKVKELPQNAKTVREALKKVEVEGQNEKAIDSDIYAMKVIADTTGSSGFLQSTRSQMLGLPYVSERDGNLFFDSAEDEQALQRRLNDIVAVIDELGADHSAPGRALAGAVERTNTVYSQMRSNLTRADEGIQNLEKKFNERSEAIQTARKTWLEIGGKP